jgi:hypothetical protein
MKGNIGIDNWTLTVEVEAEDLQVDTTKVEPERAA